MILNHLELAYKPPAVNRDSIVEHPTMCIRGRFEPSDLVGPVERMFHGINPFYLLFGAGSGLSIAKSIPNWYSIDCVTGQSEIFIRKPSPRVKRYYDIIMGYAVSEAGREGFFWLQVEDSIKFENCRQELRQIADLLREEHDVIEFKDGFEQSSQKHAASKVRLLGQSP